MKQSLQLRIGQSLKMTPQLQQAIRLLQLSSLELQTEIQHSLESNPLLEQDDNLGEITVLNYDAAGESEETNQFTETTQFTIDYFMTNMNYRQLDANGKLNYESHTP